MKVRSITLFCGDDPRRGLPAGPVEVLQRARDRMIAAGLEVQSLRVAGGDPARWVPTSLPAIDRRREFVALGQALQEQCAKHGIGFASVGALPAHEGLASEIPALLAATRSVFVALRLDDARGIDLDAVRRAAAIVQANAELEADGFANLRFAALSGVGPGVPFLPAAHHGGGVASFAVAVECADLFVDALRDVTDFAQARRALVDAIESAATRIEACVAGLDGARFLGMDFSPAPYPTPACSLAVAMESLGLVHLGAFGSAAIAAFLASAIEQAEFRRAGFNGLFFPVLEDSLLARRSAEGQVQLRDLLLWSTLCGTGLDTVPLPGNTSADALAAILLDLAAIARRLGKPLTARLMPMPGKAAGAELHFDFPYFASGGVMAAESPGLEGPLARAIHLPIDPRPR